MTSLRSRALRFVAILFFFVSSARAATITGELIDSYCFAHARIAGEGHAACALKCIHAGIPASLLEKGTRRVYVLLPMKDAGPLPAPLIAQMGHAVAIEGDVLPANGTTFLVVRSFRLTR